jgi:hypothetical protein
VGIHLNLPGGDMTEPRSDDAMHQLGDDAGARRKRPLLVVALVVAAVAVVAIVLLITRPAPGPSAPASGPAVSATADAPAGTGSTTPEPDVTATAEPPLEAPAVPLDASAEAIEGVEVSITGIRAVDGTADGVGEVAGPALDLDVRIANDTGEAVSLETSIVTVSSGQDRLPADELGSASVPLPALVEEGQTATGTYRFTVPVDRRDDVRVVFDYLAGTPAVVFEGSAPRP